MKDPSGLDVDLSVQWNGQEVSRTPYREMYWSPAQMLAHLTVNADPSRTGDLYASGTISAPARDTRGAFIELTWRGADPVTVSGRQRTFLEDGDESSSPPPPRVPMAAGSVSARRAAGSSPPGSRTNLHPGVGGPQRAACSTGRTAGWRPGLT